MVADVVDHRKVVLLICSTKASTHLLSPKNLRFRRPQQKHRVDIGDVHALIEDVDRANHLKLACLKPLEALKEQVQKEESLAHITQAESEAVKEFDHAIARIEQAVKAAQDENRTPKPKGEIAVAENDPKPALKPRRIIKPAVNRPAVPNCSSMAALHLDIIASKILTMNNSNGTWVWEL